MKKVSLVTTRNILLILSSVMFWGCAGGLSKISDDGTATELSWPKWDSVTFNKSRGTFPDPTSIAQVRAGMTKDQLYYLLGRPHYSQGWRPREWNYLFHFNTPGIGTNGITTCQYKVIFDKDDFARSFYWNTIDPIDAACGKSDEVKESKQYTLNADALFKFNRADINSINQKGLNELEMLANELRNFDVINKITVSAHTDRLGTEDYNMGLSQKRANTVREFLISRGIPDDIIVAQGFGETRPVKECESGLSRRALIDCLAPNRRVEVLVDGNAKVESASQ